MANKQKNLINVLDDTFSGSRKILDDFKIKLQSEEIGLVKSFSEGIATVSGLPHIQSNELIRFSTGSLGMAFNLDPEEIGTILLDESTDIRVSTRVHATGRVVDAPVGPQLMGRIIDPLGRPLDLEGPVNEQERIPVEQPAPEIMDRLPVEVPLQTGIKVVDALIPIGRGQRELILGDRQTGKTAIALDTIINQKEFDVICIYCSIGQKSSDVARFIADLSSHDAIDHTIIVVAGGEDPPGLQYIAPYAAMTIGEFFMRQGRDVLVVFDDLTKHARTYRELSLLLRRPPAREAYPGDIFYIHARLLERATHLTKEKGGGSLTALPIVETQEQNISAYIPTNLISITDGQIYLSPQMHQKGILPAVSVGKSVSRVGGKTQLPVYRDISGDLRLSYAQFEELESFARFSTRIDEDTRKKLVRGRRVRAVLQQPQYQPIPVPEQIAVLLAVTEGVYDPFDLDRVSDLSGEIRRIMREELTEISKKIEQGEALKEKEREAIIDRIRAVINKPGDEEEHGNA